MITLDEHIQKMRGCAKAAVEMVRKPDAENMAANVIEDIVVITLYNLRDNPHWVEEAKKRAFDHSPTLSATTPPPKKPRKTRHPSVGEGTKAPDTNEKEITLDDIKL